MIDKIEELKSFILLEEKSIKEEKTKGAIKKTKTQKQKRNVCSTKKCYKGCIKRLFNALMHD